MKNTVVLTSKQNFVWHSMQEIIPFIVDSWKASKAFNHNVRAVDVDEESLTSFLPDLIKADQIVLSCFTPKIFKLAQYLRKEMSSPARFFVHLHNQSTIACWPMRHWGGKDIFQQKDIFISSCTRDADCLKVSYPDAQCEVIPFSFLNYGEKVISDPTPIKSETPFIFIGRLSSQKNLHTLLLSFSLFRKLNPSLNPTLTFVGKADGLGSPNMGMPETGYDQYLNELSHALEIAPFIKFEGFQSRSWVQEKLNEKKWIFIAPSLHSDENFGMAAFQCLSQKHSAVLSDWGGHADFKKYFPDQVILTPVLKTPLGPSIDVNELAKSLYAAAKQYSTNATTIKDSVYYFKSLVQNNTELALSEFGTSTHLTASEVAEKILQRAESSDLKNSPKIFDSYADSLSTPFFEAYGMNFSTSTKPSAGKNKWVPWVEKKNNKIEVTDPHKGHFICPEPADSKASSLWLADRAWCYDPEVT